MLDPRSRLPYVLLPVLLIAGCASRTNTTTLALPAGLDDRRAGSATTRPILYERIGGIAGTDDRVVIWPDGVVDVIGRVMQTGTGRLTPARHEKLVEMFRRWERLDDAYVDSNVADAYTITIHYGGKSITASDIAPTLPE